MLSVSDDVLAAISDTHVTSETVATAFYQDKSAVLSITEDGELSWDADGNIQATGSLRAIGWGDSLVPRSRDALLAAYGSEVQLVRRIYLRAGETADIPLGVYRITANDGGRESTRGTEVLDWEVGVELADRFRMLEKAKIVAPASPAAGATVYSELQRLTLFPLIQDPNVPDTTAPRSLVYDERLNGVYALAELAAAKPRITRQGAMTLRPADRWATETVPDFDLTGTLGVNGGQSDDFYNYVWTHNDKGEFSQFAAILDESDPMSIDRAGLSTYEHASPAYTSNASSKAGAETILARLRSRRASTVTAELDARGLLLELSDFGWIRDEGQNRSVLGEVKSITIPHDPTERISVELIVAEEA